MCQAVMSSYHFPAWAEQRVSVSMYVCKCECDWERANDG